MDLNLSYSIDKPVAEVAAVLCDFARLGDWFPGVERCAVEGEGDGAIRTYVLGGKTYRDRLVNQAEDGLGYFYEQLEGPLPVSSLRAFLAVSAEDEERTKVEWNAAVDPGSLPEGAVESALSSMTMAGFTVLAKKLELGDQWPEEGD